MLEGIIGDTRWSSGGGTTNIEVYIAGAETVVFEGTNSTALAATAGEIAAVTQMLSLYESVLNVHFTLTNTLADADIYMAFVAGTDPTIAEVPGTLGIAMTPSTAANFQGGVLINRDAYQSGEDGLVQGGYDFITLVHEFGHALGLAHPHDTGGGSTVFPGVTPDQATGDLGDFNLNQGIYTVMSYNDGWQTAPGGPLDPSVVFDRGFEGTPMAIDIAALQFMYGANTNHNAGNTVYTLASVNAVGTFYSSIWDTGGIDEIRNTSNINSTIDLRAATLAVANGGGGFVSNVSGIAGGFTIARTVVIENATGGGGADTIVGNGANNVLLGNGGTDTLDGLGGADTLNGGAGVDNMRGGAGNDSYVVDNAGDIVNESVAGSDGVDTITSAGITINLADAGHYLGAIENATLTGAANLNAIGNGLANLLTGNAGANTLNGGAGADTARGLAGNDVYVVDNAGDVVDESVAGSGGIDGVYSSAISINLADAAHYRGTIENAVLQGTANLTLTGSTLANTLVGNAGNNTLNGLGGADYMRGGAGNDAYIVDNAGDVADESIAGSSGFDGVYSSLISINLADSVHYRGAIEAAVLQGAANLNLTGSAGANALVGNTGNNTLDGGLGNDSLNGGLGADIFRFDTALGAGNVDTLVNYSVADDTIQIDDAVFAGLSNGALVAAAFFTGASAHDADDRIIYNSATGALFFDSDGLGGTGQIQFGAISAGLAMAAGEFAVV